MSTAQHSQLESSENHAPYRITFANAAARTADASTYTQHDVDTRIRAIQLDTNIEYILTDNDPVTWESVEIDSFLAHGTSHDGDGSDPIPNATTSVAGLMSAADKTILDSLQQGNVTTACRNETGSTIPAHTLITAVGYSVAHSRPLVAAADKDSASLRPAIGITVAAVNDGTNFDALVVGTIDSIDTSAWSLRHPLVLGTAGALSRPPPDESPFTGEVQNVAVVTRVHATAGELVVSMDGLGGPITGPQVFALAGSYGTPGPSNVYVTDTDPRLEQRNVIIWEEWCAASIDPDEIGGNHNWNVSAAGTGAAVQFTGNARRYGILNLEGGTVAASRSAVFGFDTFDFSAITDEVIFEVVERNGGTITSGNLELSLSGFALAADGLVAGEPTNGIYTILNPTASANLRLVCRTASVSTTVDLGYLVVQDVWRKVEISIRNVSGTVTVRARVDGGAWSSDINTNVPTVPLTQMLKIDSNGGGTEPILRNSRVYIYRASPETAP